MFIYSFIINFLTKKRLKTLKYAGTNVSIPVNIKLSNPSHISIDDNTFIGSGSWLACVPLTGDNNCTLFIGKKCSIGRYAHIYATSNIYMEDNVLLAEKVYISDNIHAYEDIDMPIKDQPIIQKNKVFIGEGSWIGENVCIIGASIGKHTVIGANSVVTHDIPDFSVAVGSPAKVIKQYNMKENKWERV